jgi:hypothetical protein
MYSSEQIWDAQMPGHKFLLNCSLYLSDSKAVNFSLESHAAVLTGVSSTLSTSLNLETFQKQHPIATSFNMAFLQQPNQTQCRNFSDDIIGSSCSSHEMDPSQCTTSTPKHGGFHQPNELLLYLLPLLAES